MEIFIFCWNEMKPQHIDRVIEYEKSIFRRTKTFIRTENMLGQVNEMSQNTLRNIELSF